MCDVPCAASTSPRSVSQCTASTASNVTCTSAYIRFAAQKARYLPMSAPPPPPPAQCGTSPPLRLNPTCPTLPRDRHRTRRLVRATTPVPVPVSVPVDGSRTLAPQCRSCRPAAAGVCNSARRSRTWLLPFRLPLLLMRMSRVASRWSRSPSCSHAICRPTITRCFCASTSRCRRRRSASRPLASSHSASPQRPMLA
eukprot:Mycagemm_TRINITY_DN10270_c0_g3::TRINITY_DN10270_c0_g3_i1::g.3998::m.3998 type:complete len:197 gc:universal TRINITY_DN10270_c0_g3_i1:362-952(+)